MPITLPSGFQPETLKLGAAGSGLFVVGDMAMTANGEVMIVTGISGDEIKVQRLSGPTGTPDYDSLPNTTPSRFRDRRGMPIGLRDWTRLFEESDRVIDRDELKGFVLSTVWTGMHKGNEQATQAKAIYETKLWENGTEVGTWEWDTESEAKFKHDKIRTLLKAGWGSGMLHSVI